MPTRYTLVVLMFAFATTVTFAVDEPPKEWIAAGEKRRDEIPLGGDFKPQAKVAAFVAVGHGARIVVSKDDGKTWTQAFFGYPGSDHGGWASSSVAYTGGVFAVPIGWTQPTSYLASDDGVRWRHLTDGKTPLAGKDHPNLMPTTGSLAGGKGTFVGSGYTTFTATPDFGKSWSVISVNAFKNDPRGKLSTHHVKIIYCGDASGRFLALGDNRGADGPKFGHLFATDDLGKTWKWLAPKGLDDLKGRGAIASNGPLVLMTDPAAENVWCSADAGETWDGPHPTGAKRGALSVVKNEFWLVGEPSRAAADAPRASADGKTWHNLPKTLPAGKFVASDNGTLIDIDPRRFSILRSADAGATWEAVFTFTPETQYVHGAQGLRDIAFGYVNAD
ncbi:MAG TPA: sialidase family protein [Tepidisphaeraceae bacterium]|nr:sialidase family protein [Tepidisphaeraceae bacterium]